MEDIKLAAPEVPARFLEVATNLLGLITKHVFDPRDSDWLLDDKEIKILFEVVSTAGFEPGSVCPGRIMQPVPDINGFGTGNETRPLNKFCPYKVMDEDGKESFSATGWLDEIADRCRDEILRRRTDDPVYIARLIEKSVPLEPIQLTAKEDMLKEYTPRYMGIYTEHSRDSEDFGTLTVGVHKFCDGFFNQRRTTRTHKVLLCQSCGLRLEFPLEIVTYGQLRQFFLDEVRSEIGRSGPPLENMIIGSG